jgi:PAS domain S-box-containing protein
MGANEQSLRELLLALRELLLGNTSEGHSSTPSPASKASKLTPGQQLPNPQNSISRILLESLFEHAQPFYLTDSNGNLVGYSKAFAEYSEDLFGSGASFMAIIEQLYGERREIQRRDSVGEGTGERHFISRHFSINDSNGELVGFCGIYDDITIHTKAETNANGTGGLLQDVVRSTSDWIWAVDHNYNLTFISSGIAKILGTPAQMIIGRHFFSLGEFSDSDIASIKTRTDFERRASFRERVFIMNDDQGQSHHVLLSGVPVFNDSSGKFTGYRGTGTDITRRIETEKLIGKAKIALDKAYGELRIRNEELLIELNHAKAAENTKNDFLVTMTHELKTPLNSIIGFSDAAKQHIHGPLDNAYSEYFDHIHNAGQHLLELINDLLEPTNLQHENLAVSSKLESIQSIINEALSLLDTKSAHGNLDLSALSPKTDLFAFCDHLRTRQILVNLINNALKFTPDNGCIGIDVEARADDKVAITVWDTGIGIPVDQQAHVFEKFYQVTQNALSRGTKGTGLGLSISQNLAHLMKGELTLVSVPGRGSRFTLTLPASPYHS